MCPSPIPGARDGWHPPAEPNHTYICQFNAPQLKEVDNLAGWSSFAFQPKYKNGAYLCHFTTWILDHVIHEARINFISWKYLHAPYLHCLLMAVVAAFDMYNECCDGKLVIDWYNTIPSTSAWASVLSVSCYPSK